MHTSTNETYLDVIFFNGFWGGFFN
jgi:hypothetical protein